MHVAGTQYIFDCFKLNKDLKMSLVPSEAPTPHFPRGLRAFFP